MELVSHFARSAELLDNMAHDYRQLYQHMAKATRPAAGLDGSASRFATVCEESEASNDQRGPDAARLSEGASGLLRGGAKRD